ncbi:MAG: hypothetical protein Q4C63_04475 [Eubacteriales bacterium]|nr:hypothetical protein [Eubacteriales bacterium]
MTVIKDEYISRDITIHDVLPLSFLKKSMYTGSKGGMRFSMEKAEVPEEVEASASLEGAEPPKRTVLLCCVWPEPYARSETDEELIRKKEFPFSNEGIEASIVWMNEEKSGFLDGRA